MLFHGGDTVYQGNNLRKNPVAENEMLNLHDGRRPPAVQEVGRGKAKRVWRSLELPGGSVASWPLRFSEALTAGCTAHISRAGQQSRKRTTLCHGVKTPQGQGMPVPSVRHENEGVGCPPLGSQSRSFTSDEASGRAQENKPVAEPLPVMPGPRQEAFPFCGAGRGPLPPQCLWSGQVVVPGSELGAPPASSRSFL